MDILPDTIFVPQSSYMTDSLDLKVILSDKHQQVLADIKTPADSKGFLMCSDWHELPTTVITDELKRDLRLVRLRGAMDPKRFYKRAEKGRFAAKFAVGTVIEGPAEFFSGKAHVPSKDSAALNCNMMLIAALASDILH